jgi:hypothetical protein
MKTKLKITLAAVLILLMSSGVAMALSMDYTIDFGKKKDYLYFNDKKAHTFNFDVDLKNVAIKSVTLSVKEWKNWNLNGRENWAFAIGDDVYKMHRAAYKWKVKTYDITKSFELGAPFSIDLVELSTNKKYSSMYLDWITLTINYEELADLVGGPEGGPNGSPAPVPEPGTLVLLGAGLLVAARFGFRRFK